MPDRVRYGATAYWRWRSGKESSTVCGPGGAGEVLAFLEELAYSLRDDRPATLVAANLFIIPPEGDDHGTAGPLSDGADAGH